MLIGTKSQTRAFLYAVDGYVDDVLSDVPGVLSSRTSLTPAHTTVTVDPTQVDDDQILGAIQELGYPPSPRPER